MLDGILSNYGNDEGDICISKHAAGADKKKTKFWGHMLSI